jgi:hypothetical protein
MVSKVTSITPKQIYAEFNKLPKEVKVALAIFTLLAASLAVVGIRRWLFTAKPVEKIVPFQMASLFPSEAEYTNAAKIRDDIVIKSVIASPSKEEVHADVLRRNNKHLEEAKATAITKGVDSWGNEFVVITFTQNGSTTAMYCFLHKDGEKIVPYFEKMEGFNPAENLEVLFKSLIRGDNADYKLISTADLDTSVDGSLLEEKDCIKRDDFPFEIQSAFGNKLKMKNFIFYKSEEGKADDVNQAGKLDSIKAQCLVGETPTKPINLGLDAWGKPFIEVYYADKTTAQGGVCYIYCVDDTWFIENEKSSSETAEPIGKIIKGTHLSLKLVD